MSCSSAALRSIKGRDRRSLPSRCSRSKPTKISRPGSQRIAERSVAEIGQAGLVHDDGLAVDDRRLQPAASPPPRRSADTSRSSRWPLRVNARAWPRSMISCGAIAVIFDFVNPAVALGRVVDQRRQLELDKRKPVPTSFGTHARNSPHRTRFKHTKIESVPKPLATSNVSSLWRRQS